MRNNFGKNLKQNEQFESKSKAVQYLVDKNIARANIKEGCDKIKFIDGLKYIFAIFKYK